MIIVFINVIILFLIFIISRYTLSAERREEKNKMINRRDYLPMHNIILPVKVGNIYIGNILYNHDQKPHTFKKYHRSNPQTSIIDIYYTSQFS